MPGEFYYSVPLEMEFLEDECLCMEVTYSGNMIPYYEESIIPSFVKESDVWIESKYVPFASKIDPVTVWVVVGLVALTIVGAFFAVRKKQ